MLPETTILPPDPLCSLLRFRIVNHKCFKASWLKEIGVSMPTFEPKLESLVFEIRYDYGYLYFDRCGQCLLDIEKECEGWLTRNVDVATGTLERIDKRFRVGFNSIKFDFSAEQAFKTDLEDIVKEIAAVWKIIQINLDLDIFLRIGYRPVYLRATSDIDEADLFLKQSELNIKVPENLDQSGYDISTRQTVTHFIKNQIEYRVKFGSITRHEAVNPLNILQGDARALSKGQKQHRIEQLKQISEYSRNPMFAVCLDIDCVKYQPKSISIKDYILDKNRIIEEDFLPILEKT